MSPIIFDIKANASDAISKADSVKDKYNKLGQDSTRKAEQQSKAQASQTQRDDDKTARIRQQRIERVNNAAATEARKVRQRNFDALSFEDKKTKLVERQQKLSEMIAKSSGNEFRQAALRAQSLRVQDKLAGLKPGQTSESGGAFGLFSALTGRMGMGWMGETLTKLGLRGAVGGVMAGLAGVGGLAMFLNSQGQAALSKREEGISEGRGKSARDIDIESYRKMGFDTKTSASLAVRSEDQRVNEDTGRSFSWAWGQAKKWLSWGTAFATNSLKMLYKQAAAKFWGGDPEEVYRVAAEERIRRDGDPNADITSRLEARLENARRRKAAAKPTPQEYYQASETGKLRLQEIHNEGAKSRTDFLYDTGQIDIKTYAKGRESEIDADFRAQEEKARLSAATIEDKTMRDIQLKAMLDAIAAQKDNAMQNLMQGLQASITMPQVQMPGLSNTAQIGLFATRGESVMAQEGLQIQTDILNEMKAFRDQVREDIRAMF